MPQPKIPNCVLLREKKEAKIKGKGGEWPIKLINFKDVINLSKATILPYYY